jgi:hypothetical protein
MSKGEPPSMFRIGRDSHGRWVVQDQEGLRGGFFVNRAQALKYAMFENGNRPQAVVMVPGTMELEMGSRPSSFLGKSGAPELRRVA